MNEITIEFQGSHRVDMKTAVWTRLPNCSVKTCNTIISQITVKFSIIKKSKILNKILQYSE
jgi:hypothetical protein